jgi:maltose alpha-D-glucosyltransferase/alpha-amylase
MSLSLQGPEDPLWYKDAIIYELHVRSFFDSDGDGIGDFRGLTQKLDYLEDLGVNTLWLLPFYPSPLKDDGYDISDYTAVHPSYGTLADFRTFIQEAHRRGLRVVTELVLNHTSDQHRWFQRARRAPPGDPARDWYVWSPTPERYRDVRVIFSDFEPSNWSWDPVAQAYYWHRFYAHQPDLNFLNPEVPRAIIAAAEFWLSEGVDGFRLDAIPYLYEREGTTCENLPETHEFLRTLRRHIDERFPHRMLLAEANQWPEDAAAYFGAGDECHMAFHFPIMTRLFLAVHMEDRYPMVDILSQSPVLPPSAQWALFLRNHDELTLEMVTDQERDYMYRVYAQDRAARINLGIRRRLAPLLQNNRKKIELMSALLFSLPGTPVIYYGDEIGMGDNIFLGDRNGVRTPMQWSGDRNAGFSRANAQRLYLPVVVDPEYHYEAVNVEAQQANPQSLLWWTKRLLALSRRFRAFGRGTFELLTPENRKVLAFVRRYQEELVLVVANLSRFSQYVELDLAFAKGRTPVELFGRAEFPKVGDAPYLLTLGPHAFYWFALEPAPEAAAVTPGGELDRTATVAGDWKAVLSGRTRQVLEPALLGYMKTRPWFAGRARPVRSFRIAETFLLPAGETESVLVFAHVDYDEGEPETYSIPLSFVKGDRAQKVRKDLPEEVVLGLRMASSPPDQGGVLMNALADEGFLRSWIRLLAEGAGFPNGQISAFAIGGFEADRLLSEELLPAVSLKAEPVDSVVGLRGHWALTWYRLVQEGVHPEVEVARFAAARGGPGPALAWAAAWELLQKGREPLTLAALRVNAPDARDALPQALDELGRYFESVRSSPPRTEAAPNLADRLLPETWDEPSAEALSLVGPYLESVRKMAEATARLHQFLASDASDPAFAPEMSTAAHVRSHYQTLRRKVMLLGPSLRRAARARPEVWGPRLEEVREAEPRLLEVLGTLLQKQIGTVRIRCHGDLGLAHFTSVGPDYVVTGLPGPAGAPFVERRLKRAPLWDVAGMLGSLHSVAVAALANQESLGEVAVDRWAQLERGAVAWHECVARTYLRVYRMALSGTRLEGTFGLDWSAILRTCLMERALDDVHLALPRGSEGALVGVRRLLNLLRELPSPRSPGPGSPLGGSAAAPGPGPI